MAKKGRAGKSRGSLTASGDGMGATGHEADMSAGHPGDPHELHASDGPPASARAPERGAFASAEADPFAAGSRPDGRVDTAVFDEDDTSVPPIGDLDTEFFARASDSWAPPVELHEAEPTPPNPRLVALKSISARRRRARFTKYVTAAVGVCGVVCLTAMVKLVVSQATGADESEGLAAAHAVAVADTPAPAAASVLPEAVPQAPAQAPVAATAAAAEPAASAAVDPPPNAAPPVPDPAAVASASPPAQEQAAPPTAAPAADNANAAASNAAPAPPTEAAGAANAANTPAPNAAIANPATASMAAATGDSAAEAAAAREVARTELSRGHARQSIEAGERSVALDPTDGEAWLVLGAAYQSRGAVADARRCFKACVSQAKRGPRGECSAMLR